jgi:hypothetical protein|tara:strand:- start:2633 stop:3073 length:441 start_codon:yes stop_codon:yes gene_type:complete
MRTKILTKIAATAGMLCLILLASSGLQPNSVVYAQDQKVYEMRTYTVAPGRLPALLKRFSGGEVDLFVKHGMTSVGYWVPDDEELSENTLVYMLAHDSREAAAASWKAFGADPLWPPMRAASVADGPIVTDVQNLFLDPTNFSPLN